LAREKSWEMRERTSVDRVKTTWRMRKMKRTLNDHVKTMLLSKLDRKIAAMC